MICFNIAFYFLIEIAFPLIKASLIFFVAEANIRWKVLCDVCIILAHST